MNIEDINLGDPPTGAGGDTIRDAFGKTNQNFGAAKQALEDEVQSREQLLATQRDQLIALIESVNGPLPDMRADFKARSFGFKNEAGVFLPCEYDDLFTLSAPSPKWVWDKSGKLVEVPAGQPAWDRDPVTGQPLGQRLEPEDTNGHTNGQLDIAVSDYTITDANDPYLPDAKILTDDVGHESNQHTNLSSEYPFGTTGGSNQALRIIYVKEGLSRYMRIGRAGLDGFTFDLVNREIVPESVTGNGTPRAINKGNGWWELSFMRTWSSAAANSYRVSYGSSIDGDIVTSQIGDQITLAYPSMYDKDNPIPPSIIKTNGGAVTRSADVVTIQNVDTAEWFDDQNFTIFWDYTLGQNLGTSGSSLSLSLATDSGVTNSIGIYSGNRLYIRSPEGTDITPIPGDSYERKKLAFSISPARILVYANGSQVVELDDSYWQLILQEVTQLYISRGQFRGELYDCQSFKRALTASELQELTS